MEENNNYELEFGMYYLDLTSFKQKQSHIIQGCIGGGRLNEYMRFNSYAIMSFDSNDHKHRYPKVQLIDKFNRSKCNCMMYDLSYNSKNNGMYDKCFIFQTSGKTTTYFGIYFYNSETKKCNTIFLIESLYDNLCIKLMQSLDTMLASHIYAHYSEKYDCIRERNGKKINDCPGLNDYNEMMNKYKERLQIETKW